MSPSFSLISIGETVDRLPCGVSDGAGPTGSQETTGARRLGTEGRVVADKVLECGDDLIEIGQGCRVVCDPLVRYRAILLDDKDGALGQPLEAGQVLVLDPILGNDLFVVIAQEGEIDPHLF